MCVTLRCSGTCLALALLGIAGPTRADEKAACAQAHFHAQELRRDGKLLAAKQELLSCVRQDCPGVIQTECAQWLSAAEAALPSVVVVAKDETGRDLVNVELEIDGKTRTNHLDGRALQLDP